MARSIGFVWPAGKRLLAVAVMSLSFAAQLAQAETRVALVIGNSAYKHARALANPKNDAEGMAAPLKWLGFEVVAGTDREKPAISELLQVFADKTADTIERPAD